MIFWPFQKNSEFRRRNHDFSLKKTFFQILSVFQTHLCNFRKFIYTNDFYRFWIKDSLFARNRKGKKNGGERVGFSQPPAEFNFTLQGSLFQDVIL